MIGALGSAFATLEAVASGSALGDTASDEASVATGRSNAPSRPAAGAVVDVLAGSAAAGATGVSRFWRPTIPNTVPPIAMTAPMIAMGKSREPRAFIACAAARPGAPTSTVGECVTAIGLIPGRLFGLSVGLRESRAGVGWNTAPGSGASWTVCWAMAR